MFNKHFMKIVLKYSIFFAIGIAVLIAIDFIQLKIPLLLGEIIDLLSNTQDPTLPQPEIPTIQKIAIEIITIVAIVGFGRFVWRLFIFGTSRRVEYELRNKMFAHATKLPQEYYSHEKVGGMMTYFINDLAAVRMAFGPGIMMLIDSIFLGGFAIMRMYRIDRNMTLVALIPISLMVVLMIFINKSMRRQFRIRQEKFHDLSDYTQENFSGISVIKAYVREAYELNTFNRRSEELYTMNMRFFKRSIWLNMSINIALNAIIVLILGFGGYLVISTNGKFSDGDLTAYYSLFISITWPIMALARFFTLFSQAQASAKRITDFLDSPVVVKDRENVIEVENIEPSIMAKNLTFSYPDDDIRVLDEITFNIEAGEMVGILGKTGSGKTTLVDLMLRVYNIREGQLYLGGYDIMRLPIKKVREIIGYVPQDNFLFSDTIYNNISFAYDNLDEEKVYESAKLADVYNNIVDFAEGFETILGERGVTVSGGQKQRISIARAIAKNPEILILDDAVSAVDTKTEETIINNLYNLRKGKTTIFIAHRISTVKNMDKIIILDEGKIVDIGTHDELLARSAFYRDMVERQKLEEMVEGGNF